MSKVGKYLKKKREEADLSLREASKLANVSHTHIMDLEEGKKSPAFDKVMQILQAYRADVQDFLRETGYLPKNVSDWTHWSRRWMRTQSRTPNLRNGNALTTG